MNECMNEPSTLTTTLSSTHPTSQRGIKLVSISPTAIVYRSVKYVLSLMCKCIMVKVGGSQKREKERK